MRSVKTSNVLYVALFFTGMLLIVNTFVVAPSRKMKVLREELTSVRESVARAETELDSLRSRASEPDTANSDQTATVLSAIELLTKKLEVQGVVFKRLETGRDEEGIVPFSLDARGSFRSIVAYLHKLSVSPVPILVLDMSLSPETDDGSVFSLQISGQLALRKPNG